MPSIYIFGVCMSSIISGGCMSSIYIATGKRYLFLAVLNKIQYIKLAYASGKI